tara:strand:+ start:221 stop:499 length:279 start_codon:yes stop_codon:yes gene_type:complete
MIPKDKNFEKDFKSVSQDLDGVLQKYKKINPATFCVAMISFVTRRLIALAPNDFIIVEMLLGPYLASRRSQVDNEKKEEDENSINKNTEPLN